MLNNNHQSSSQPNLIDNFPYPPTPQILQSLSVGQFANRFIRSVRLWVLLNRLYSINWVDSLPQVFTYSQLRNRLFSHRHPQAENLSVDEIIANCNDKNCICHQTLNDIVFNGKFQLDKLRWVSEVTQLTGLNSDEIKRLLDESPFATVHRSIRDDLKQLVSQRWLTLIATGKYQGVESQNLPLLSSSRETALEEPSNSLNLSHLSLSQTWELLRVLESVAFVQPNLSLIINSLWEQIGDSSPNLGLLESEPQQRIFLHLDYIISKSKQDLIDTYQEQLESLWHKPPGGVIQFEYWVATKENKAQITVYPVCLHYLRRAKYLSAYGVDPDGHVGWHNYRLDRIASERLKILAWGDPAIPKDLKNMWRTGELPTPEYVSHELEKAWGFNFYLPKELLILRFPSQFAKWYVNDTFRHQTFRSVSHQQLSKIATRDLANKKQRGRVLEIIKQRSPKDVYYTAWIRTGDVNVLMRLRDWRPNGEVIAPIAIREQLALEAVQELENYQI